MSAIGKVGGTAIVMRFKNLNTIQTTSSVNLSNYLTVAMYPINEATKSTNKYFNESSKNLKLEVLLNKICRANSPLNVWNPVCMTIARAYDCGCDIAYYFYGFTIEMPLFYVSFVA